MSGGKPLLDPPCDTTPSCKTTLKAKRNKELFPWSYLSFPSRSLVGLSTPAAAMRHRILPIIRQLTCEIQPGRLQASRTEVEMIFLDPVGTAVSKRFCARPPPACGLVGTGGTRCWSSKAGERLPLGLGAAWLSVLAAWSEPVRVGGGGGGENVGWRVGVAGSLSGGTGWMCSLT